MRRCVACYNSYPKEQLLRFTLKDNILTPDIDKCNEGRGVYLCRKQECLDIAIKKNAFSKAYRKPVDMKTNCTVIEQLISNTKEE